MFRPALLIASFLLLASLLMRLRLGRVGLQVGGLMDRVRRVVRGDRQDDDEDGDAPTVGGRIDLVVGHDLGSWEDP